MSYSFFQTLDQFSPITLGEMDSVSLLDRTDTKFVFHINMLDRILQEAQPDYRTLTVKDKRYSAYETFYFDTENLKFYHDHQNQRSNRFKVRTRSYVDSHIHFFEIKHKSNQGRTVKKRVVIPEQFDRVNGDAAKLLKDLTGLGPEVMKRTLQINCKRITLVNKGMTERVTVDFDMKYCINGEWHPYTNICIIEIKQDKINKSLFMKIMHDMHIQSRSLSKYSFGIANLMPKIKNNNFKTQILYVNKICNQFAC